MSNKKITVKEKKIGLSEVYKIVKRKLETPEQWALNNEISRLQKMSAIIGQPIEGLKEMIAKLNAITEIVSIKEYSNLVPTAGLEAISDHLANNSPTPSTLKINNVALGTGTTAPAAGDTTLETEVYRNNVASSTNSGAIAYVSGFFSATEDDDTYREVGLFINGDGTGNPDTGTLFSRSAINITKSNTETLTIDYTLTLTAVT